MKMYRAGLPAPEDIEEDVPFQPRGEKHFDKSAHPRAGREHKHREPREHSPRERTPREDGPRQQREYTPRPEGEKREYTPREGPREERGSKSL